MSGLPTGAGGRIRRVRARRASRPKESHSIQLPDEARFKDYSALAYRDGQVAIVSQEIGVLVAVNRIRTG